MNDTKFNQARIADNGQYIIDSDNRRVEYDDPRIVHAWVIDNSPYSKRLMKAIFEKNGIKYRAAGECTEKVMKCAKQLCSGRECVPATAITGLTLVDLENYRGEDEITLYFSLNQEGPCQNGAWPALWDTFNKRLKKKNVIFMADINPDNNFLGLTTTLLKGLGASISLGHFLEEAENALQVVARDVDSAMETFETETEKLIVGIKNDQKNNLKRFLKKWAEKIAKIPRKASVEETPKVLIFGGLNLLFVHHPVTRYFIDQGIIPKVVDLAESLQWINSESIMRYGFKKGIINPAQQLNMKPIIFDALFKRKNKEEARNAFMRRVMMMISEIKKKQYRKIMDQSHLMFDPLTPFVRIASAGHKHVTYAAFTETSTTTGKYVCSVEDNVYDGLINLGSFNCQPAMNSRAVIRPLANTNDIPYAALDVEGPWITTNHQRLLETIAVQAKRNCELKKQTV